ncbi:MAG TPA: ABC transporter permease [Gemmatimonadales bacterium]|nr:ABC transporter permease [Gemmatimonadales bacterium]
MNLHLLRIREMVKKELRQLFRDVRTRGLIFVSPIIQLVLFGYAVNTDIRNTTMVVVDHDQTAEARALVDAFTASGYFRVVERSVRPAALVAALDRGDAEVGLEIPVHFARDLAADGPAHVQLIVDGTNSNTGTVALGYATRIMQRYAAEHTPGRTAAGVDLRVRAWYNPNLESRVYNVPGVIGVLVLLMCLLLTALAVVRERELGTLDQLMVSPLTPAELMLGKTLPVAMIGLIDMATITVVAILWFHIPFRGSVLVLLPAALMYIVAGLSVGLFISTISKTQQEAFMTMFLFLLPSIILSGFFYPIRSMPAFFRTITIANPVRHFLEVVRAVFLKGAGFEALWHQFVLLAVLASLMLGVAIWRFPKTIGR